jgi:hypothetical protein
MLTSLTLTRLLPNAAALAGAAIAVSLALAPAMAASKNRPVTGKPPVRNTPMTFHDEVWAGGRKFCFSDHYHYGSGGTERTKAAAMASAADAWANFVNFEYGGAYDNFRIAESKAFSCSGAGNAWSCSVEARPCHIN